MGLGRPLTRVGVAGQIPACFLASAVLLLAPASLKQGGSCSSDGGKEGRGRVVAAGSGEALRRKGCGKQAEDGVGVNGLPACGQSLEVALFALLLLMCVFLGSI